MTKPPAFRRGSEGDLFKPIRAYFDGWCPRCEQAIVEGQMIERDREWSTPENANWVHFDCAIIGDMERRVVPEILASMPRCAYCADVLDETGHCGMGCT